LRITANILLTENPALSDRSDTRVPSATGREASMVATPFDIAYRPLDAGVPDRPAITAAAGAKKDFIRLSLPL
jgi:hypothetical protein